MDKQTMKVLIVLFVMFFHLQVNAEENIVKITKDVKANYVEIELHVLAKKDGREVTTVEVALYEAGKLSLYVEANGYFDSGYKIYTVRVSPDSIDQTNVSIVYGDGLLCDAIVYNYKLNKINQK